MSGLDFNDAGRVGSRLDRDDYARHVPRPTPDLHALRRLHGGELSDGGRRLSMPGPGHGRHDRSLSVRLSDDGRLLTHSFAGDDFLAVCSYLGLDAPQGHGESQQQRRRQHETRALATAREQATKVAFCREVWGETLPAPGSLVEAYLGSRLITGSIPDALRFHPSAPLGYDRRLTAPAMVAIVTGPDDKSCGLHVTALRADGMGKADMPNARRMFGSMAGAAVRLFPPSVSGELAVAEGIETALAYRKLTGLPVWAALSTSGLRGFTPPASVKRLVIAGDGDKAGLDAAMALAERLARRCACAVASAPDAQDWNDVLKGMSQ